MIGALIHNSEPAHAEPLQLNELVSAVKNSKAYEMPEIGKLVTACVCAMKNYSDLPTRALFRDVFLCLDLFSDCTSDGLINRRLAKFHDHAENLRLGKGCSLRLAPYDAATLYEILIPDRKQDLFHLVLPPDFVRSVLESLHVSIDLHRLSSAIASPHIYPTTRTVIDEFLARNETVWRYFRPERAARQQDPKPKCPPTEGPQTGMLSMWFGGIMRIFSGKNAGK